MYERSERDDDRDGTAPRSGVSPALIGLVVVAILAVVFVLQNGERTGIDFLFFTFNASVWVAIAIAIGIGIVLDRLVVVWWRRRRRADR